MPHHYSYKILGYYPPQKSGIGTYGFHIHLERDFARKALSTEMPEILHERMQQAGRAIISNSKLAHKKPSRYEKVFYFVENEGKPTLLLQYCQVPGNACDLGMDVDDIKRLQEEIRNGKNFDSIMNWIEYGPHNVDNIPQAYSLLSAWLHWQEYSIHLISPENH